MDCPVCGKKMLMKESDLDGKPVTFAVCNNFRCDFDEELWQDKPEEK